MNKYEQLIYKALEGEASQEELATLKAWCDASKENLEMLRKLRKTWNLTSRQLISTQEAAVARSQFLERIAADGEQKTPRRYYHLKAWIGGVAAAVALLLCVSVMFNLKGKDKLTAMEDCGQVLTPRAAGQLILSSGRVVALDRGNGTAQTMKAMILAQQKADDYDLFHDAVLTVDTLRIPQAGYYKVKLPDGTLVMLNARSEIYFPEKFTGKIRKVGLKGEAYFQVRHDIEHPFVVSTVNGTEIKVLGTKFNVNAMPSGRVQTTLVSGCVSVKSRGNQPVVLQPNQQVEVSDNGVASSVRNVDAYLYTAWTEGRLVFENMSMEDIMACLSNNYGLKVEFANEHIKKERFTGAFMNDTDIRKVLDTIESTTSVHFTVKGNVVTVK